MRAVIQRVSEASVIIEGKLFSQIGKGLLILVGIEEADGIAQRGCVPVYLCPIDANNFRVFKARRREGAAWQLDETQVATLKCTADKPAGTEDRLDKGTTEEPAVDEFA